MAVMRTLSAQQLLLQEEAKRSTWSQYSYEYATVTVIDGCLCLTRVFPKIDDSDNIGNK